MLLSYLSAAIFIRTLVICDVDVVKKLMAKYLGVSFEVMSNKPMIREEEMMMKELYHWNHVQ